MLERFSNMPFALPLKNYKLEKEDEQPKIIEIRGGKIIDIDNGESCLIGEDGVRYFSLRDKEGRLIENVTGVTSHSFMTCAEIYGTLSDGNKFYIHCRDAEEFKNSLEKMVDFKNTDITVENIVIRCDFARESLHDDHEKVAEKNMEEYENMCESLGIDNSAIEIDNMEYGGVFPEKVVTKFSEEDRKYKNR